MKVALQYDYTVVGHVTIDVLDDGSSRAGGTALYSAVQAARLGRRTLIVTQGVPEQIGRMLEPFAGELDFDVLPAKDTTTLQSSGWGVARRQRLLAWAGAMPETLSVHSTVLHLAPVARETPNGWLGEPDVLVLTPQGLARQWPAPAGPIALTRPGRAAEQLAGRCDALALSEHERASCAELIAAARGAGAVVAVTDGPNANTILTAEGPELRIEVPRIVDPVDDLGAGDVYAAAFFIALAEGRPAQEAARFATAAAAVRMRGLDAQAIGDRGDIEARLEAVAALD